MDKRYRLRKQGEFKLVRSEGRSYAHPLLVLYARPNKLAQTRVGFSVGKRLGKAVVRNRVKRRLREMVRHLLTEVRPGFDVLLIARLPAATVDYAALLGAFQQVLSRSGLSNEAATGDKRLRQLGMAQDNAGQADSGLEQGKV